MLDSNLKVDPDRDFFGKLKSRLNRGKSWLRNDLLGLFDAKLDERTIEDLETKLLLADVGVDATQYLLDRLRQRRAGPDGNGADAIARLRAGIVELLSPLEVPLAIDARCKPFVIVAVGVNGTGKTTSLGKLAFRLKQSGYSVMLAAADTFRAAAVEQLQEWGKRIDAPVLSQQSGADPAAVVHDAIESARARQIDVVLVDTAGRLHTASGLMDELAKIKRVAGRSDPSAPHEILLVLDAGQGQNALAQAMQFHERLGVTGLIVTKLDGSAKGGILLAIARRLAIPIRFISIGEAIEDLDEFKAAQFAAALLGEADA